MDLKTINIKGKEYVTVAERVRGFNENFPNGSITTEVTQEGTYVRCKAIVTPDVTLPARFFTGHSEEDRTQGNINKTNATENCETSAVGRALGMMGIGIVEGIASADEMVRFEQKAQTTTSTPTTQPSASNNAPKCSKCGAGMAISKRNGKEYCSALCWNTPKPANTVQADVIIADEAADVRLQDIPF